MMNEQYYTILLKLSKKAYKKNEVPISAIIVYKNKIIAKAYNKKNLEYNPLLHAEIICIKKACKKLKSWNLNDCNMYVSLKPCEMCEKIISESRISNVFYFLDRGKITNKYSKTKYVQMFYNNNEDMYQLLKDFFNKIRK